jgi:ribosomal protein S18 acetylase RimI-like enzyme
LQVVLKKLFQPINYQTIMLITNCTHADMDTMFAIYDFATERMRPHTTAPWVGFARTMVEQEIAEQRQWKIVEDGQIACVFLTTYTDPHIWGERDQDPSVYIHRIATHPQFLGRFYVKTIVDWAKIHAKDLGKTHVRLDTGAGNPKITAYYQKAGFDYLGDVSLSGTDGLPAHYNIHQKFSIFEINLAQIMG